MISRKTIEELMQKNDARLAKLTAEAALIEGEQAAFRKILAADSDAPKEKVPRRSWGEIVQRVIPEIQMRKTPMHVSAMLTALNETDDDSTRRVLNTILLKMAKAKDKFVHTGTREYGLIVLGHVPGGRVVNLLADKQAAG